MLARPSRPESSRPGQENRTKPPTDRVHERLAKVFAGSVACLRPVYDFVLPQDPKADVVELLYRANLRNLTALRRLAQADHLAHTGVPYCGRQHEGHAHHRPPSLFVQRDSPLAIRSAAR